MATDEGQHGAVYVVDDEPDGEAVLPTTPTPRFPRTRLDTLIDVVVGVICTGTATAWTLDPFRQQFADGSAANFFDLQARALLDGHLAIPQGELGIEAFVHDGNEYMYFGPLLALLRLPLAVVTDHFDGRLTLISLLIATLVFYVQAIKLFDVVFDLVHPIDAASEGPQRLENWMRRGWRVSVATGTVVLTLLSIPWVYHEAHLWSAALFLALLNQLLLFPQGRCRVWTLGLILVAVGLNRPTTAYAGMIGVTILIGVLWLRQRAPWQRLVALGAWSGVALVSMVVINVAKFGRLFGIPMEDQIFSTIDPHRAAMLAHNGNRYVRLEFIPSNLWAYFRPFGVDVSTTFPFIGLPRSLPWVWGDAFFDVTSRTASVTATNPLLVVLSIVGLVVFVRLFRSESFWILVAPVIASIAAAGGVIGWGYITTRYLTDFLPGMLVLAAIALAALAKYAAGREAPVASRRMTTALVAAGVLVVWSVLANLAIAFSYSFSAGDSAAEVTRLLSVQDAAASVIGPDLEDRVIFVDALPYDRLHPPAPGTLAVLGECDALYYSNGEPVDSWIEVEKGVSEWHRVYEITPSGSSALVEELELVRLTETPDRDAAGQYWLSLVLRADDVQPDPDELAFSFVVRDSFGELVIDELEPLPLDERSEIAVTFEQGRGRFFAEVNGDPVSVGHFAMTPLYQSADPGIFFAPSGTYGGYRLAGQSLETPWCDRLSAGASRP